MSVSKGNLNVSVKEDFVGDFVILKESTNYIIDSLNSFVAFAFSSTSIILLEISFDS